MRLADLRRVAVKKQVRIRFGLSNGMECILNEHGIAQVPALRAPPAFNLEEELAVVSEFRIEPAIAEKDKTKSKSRSYTREQMAGLLSANASGETAHDEHDE